MEKDGVDELIGCNVEIVKDLGYEVGDRQFDGFVTALGSNWDSNWG